MLGQRKFTLSRFLSPDFSFREFHGNNLLYLPEELAFPSDEQLNEAVEQTKPITPFKLAFDLTQREVTKILGKPVGIIDDDKYLKNHKILIYKRMVDSYQSTTQVHLFNKKVFVVVEEIKKRFNSEDLYYSKVVDLLNYTTGPLEDPIPHNLLLTDSKGNILRIEEDVTIRLIFQKKG